MGVDPSPDGEAGPHLLVVRQLPAAATGGCPAGYLRVRLPHPAAGHPWPALDIPPAAAAGPEPSSRFRKRSTARTRASWRRLSACRLYHHCAIAAAAGVEAVSYLPTAKRNCRTREAGISAAGDACTTTVDFRAGAGGCPGPSRAPAGVRTAGQWRAGAGRGRWTWTPAGGSTPAKARGGRREATTEQLTDARTGRLSAITPEP